MPDPQIDVRWPAEWEPHRATWIAWPHQKSDWPGKFAAIPWVYAEIARHLSSSEPVQILVNDAKSESQAHIVLKRNHANMQNIRFQRIRTDRCWTRDSGPTIIRNGNRRAALDWRFNAWAKYPNYATDDAVAAKIAKCCRVRQIRPVWKQRRVVLEGGSVEGDGKGTMLTTEECLLSNVQARNPGFSRKDYEEMFLRYLGIRKVIWLGRGIVGDDTHGHIDDLARFVAPGVVVTVVEPNESDDNHAPLQENLERLSDARDAAGRRIQVVTLPMPAPVLFRGQRLPASYANFYIANECVIVPTFNAPQDRKALGILSDLFPNRKVVGIHSTDLVWGLGTLHCLTQQEPE
jgi:agmatine deiminase